MGIRTLFELSTGAAGFNDGKRPSRPLRQKYKGPAWGLSFLEEGMGIRTLFELSTGAAGFNDAKRPSRPLRQKYKGPLGGLSFLLHRQFVAHVQSEVQAIPCH